MHEKEQRVLERKLQRTRDVNKTSHNRGKGTISKEFQLLSISHKCLSQLQFWAAAKYLLPGMQKGRRKLPPPILSIPKGPVQMFPLTLPKTQLNIEPRGCCLTNTLLKEWHEKYFAATGDLLENYIKSQYNFAKSKPCYLHTRNHESSSK